MKRPCWTARRSSLSSSDLWLPGAIPAWLEERTRCILPPHLRLKFLLRHEGLAPGAEQCGCKEEKRWHDSKTTRQVCLGAFIHLFSSTFCLGGAAPSVCESEKKCNRGIHCRQLVRRGPHLFFSFQYSRYAAVQSEQTKSRSRHQLKTREAQCLRLFQKDLHIHVFDVSVQRSGPNVRGLSLNRATVAPAVVGSRSKRFWASACPR